MGKAHNAVYHLIEGPVSAAGIDAKRFPGLGCLAGQRGDVPRLPRNLNLIFQTAASSGNLGLELPGMVLFSGGRGDEKEMPHFRLPPMYIYYSHWIIPLYNFRRLSARRPK